ncbi:MAG: hypothetical protein M0Z50_06235 [Planctomycetia bacterium]|nr:hypothetical protein [Planctomycetia bacterium]
METSNPSTLLMAAARTLIPDPAAIVVPRQHGMILVEPPAAKLAEFVATMTAGARPPSTLSDTPIHSLAHLARQELLDGMIRFARETGFEPPGTQTMARSWVITGHQVEFYHPGVWTKVILADALSRQNQALAIDLLVDHDTVDHLGLVVPEWNGNRLRKTMVTWTEASALPAEFSASPQGAQKSRWLENLRQFPLANTDSMRQFMASLATDSDPRYVAWMSRTRRSFEQSLGLTVQHVPCGYICSGVAWHSFVLAWLRQARDWCKAYNMALNQYRLEHNITNSGRPMPNLAITQQEMELPFWIYADHQPRHRMALFENNGTYLVYGDQRIAVTDVMAGDLIAAGESLRNRLKAATLHVRPRALTLTMFVRLLLSDLFIHGIGGALYDRMTDQIMEQLFGVRPAYACASAGWLLPLAEQMDPAQADISRLKWQQHHLRSNPELFMASAPLSGQAGELLKQRRDLIAGIAQCLTEDRSQQLRRSSRWLQRRADFRRLHEINAQLRSLFGPQAETLAAQRRFAEFIKENMAVANWREYFIALHSHAALEQLVAAIRAMAATPSPYG